MEYTDFQEEGNRRSVCLVRSNLRRPGPVAGSMGIDTLNLRV